MGENGRFVERNYLVEGPGRKPVTDLYNLFSVGADILESKGFRVLNALSDDGELYVLHEHGAVMTLRRKSTPRITVVSRYGSGQTNLAVGLHNSFGLNLVEQDSRRLMARE